MNPSSIYFAIVCGLLTLQTITSETGILPEKCGQRNMTANLNSSWRIVGGKQSLPGEWPWQAYIKVAGIVNGFMYSTSFDGTLIHEQWILTVANGFHVDSNQTDITVYLGVLDLKQIDSTNDTTIVKTTVDKLIVHEEFDYGGEKNDIALIKIHQKIDFADKHRFLQPICVASFTTEPLKKCFASGWGDTDAEGTHSTALMSVELPIFNNITQCQTLFPKVTEEQHICAGGTQSGGVGTCYRDAGGPLRCMTESDGKWYQIGVTSLGRPCAKPEIPDVFTRVAHYKSWIENTIRNNP